MIQGAAERTVGEAAFVHGTDSTVPVAIVIDSVAEASLRAREVAPAPEELCCDACDEVIEGEPDGHGYYVWARGDEVRREEPPLCGRCATAIGITALQAWSIEEEEG